MTLALAFFIGLLTGGRAFLAIALVAWSAAFGWLDAAGTALGWLGAPAPAAILTLLAMGELYGDKQASMGNRTARAPLAARIVLGALAGGLVALGASVTASPWAGAAMGALGAAIGTFATFRLRAWLATRLGRDLRAALIEDALLIAGIVAVVALA
ncbi:DUF4126 domain-containing protein [Sphingomicrobium flavum]|uniref:DUF4126 domain-containing protein n=1 Tax=Sphingomicrobium flavum TaxID=1229164 RepID=UPI0021AE2CB3|nr:DUF4126 domain-containing protein [Sphingomicrobium flavum]